MSIFVSIASYCDPQLVPTIDNMLQMADDPSKLTFGICMQDTEEAFKTFKYRGNKQFRIIYVPFKDSLGCCWARSRIQSLYKNEEYHLQLDSHHRFVKGWDTLCKSYLKMCDSKKPILTTYVNQFNPDEGNAYLKKQHPTKMMCKRFYETKWKVQFVPVSIFRYENLTCPQKSALFSAHFVFTYGKWILEVPYDPEFYFDGEEDSLAVRSWTNGWDLYYPHRVICYHEYTRKGRTKQWEVDKQWWKKDQTSIKRMKQLFRMDDFKINLGKYGLGKVRTLEQYERFSGIDFKTRTLSDMAKRGRVITNYADPKKPFELNKWATCGTTYKKLENKKWGEYKDNKLFCKFDERESINIDGNRYVLMYDEGRNLSLKLTDSVCYCKVNDNSDWGVIYEGEWQ